MRHVALVAIFTVICGLKAAAARLSAAEPAASAKKDERRSASPQPRLFVPAYFYPAGEGLKHWDRLLEAAERVPIVAVVNPASGPGRATDPNYVKVIERAGKTKITLLGYVSTSYAKRPLADVKADIDQWPRLYSGLAGVFFDEQASGGEHLDYYATLAKDAREKAGLKLVVTNPGTVCDEKYLSPGVADVACLFEGPKVFDPASLPGWVKRSSDHVLLLSYKVATADAMRKSLDAASGKVGYIYIYVTDSEGANPWDRLPSYWDEEVAVVRQMLAKKK